MASINYGSPLSFLGPAFYDIDNHPGRSGAPSPTLSTHSSNIWLHDQVERAERKALEKQARQPRSLADSWETIAVYSAPMGGANRAAAPASPVVRAAPVYVMAQRPPDDGGFFGSLRRFLGELFS